MGKYKYKPDFRGFSRACKDKKLHFLQPEEYAGGVVVFGVWQPGPSCLSHLALTTVTEFSPSWQTGLAHPISLRFWLRLSSHHIWLILYHHIPSGALSWLIFTPHLVSSLVLELSHVHQAGYGPADDPETCEARFSFRANLGQGWNCLGQTIPWVSPCESNGARRKVLEERRAENSCTVRAGFPVSTFSLPHPIPSILPLTLIRSLHLRWRRFGRFLCVVLSDLFRDCSGHCVLCRCCP